jgi:hypothetical protein
VKEGKPLNNTALKRGSEITFTPLEEVDAYTILWRNHRHDRRLYSLYEAIENYSQWGDFDKLCKALKTQVYKLTNYVYYKLKYYNIDKDSIESEIWNVIALMIEDGYYYSFKLPFIYRLQHNVKNNLLSNLHKHMKADKRVVNHDPRLYKSLEELSEYGVEIKDYRAIGELDNVLNKMQVEAIYSKLGTGLFTKEQEKILWLLKEQPSISDREMDRIMNVHHTTIGRNKKKIAKALIDQGLDWENTGGKCA